MNMRKCHFQSSLPVFLLGLVCGAGAADAQIDKRDDDDDKLGRKLVQKVIEGRDEDIMDRLFSLMSKAALRLDLEFDAGERTQQIQKEILKELDEAIEAAAAQTRKSKSKARPSGDKRKMTKPSAGQAKSGSGDNGKGDGSSPQLQPGKTMDAATADQEKDFDVRRGWGLLPPRERDEVIQGYREEFLEAYRIWIEKYYRALQETQE
ncbi:MAG: hypothetical protein ACYTHJ_17685 [Planctomycetota bacterium]|jgi:hypothetical protein